MAVLPALAVVEIEPGAAGPLSARGPIGELGPRRLGAAAAHSPRPGWGIPGRVPAEAAAREAAPGRERRLTRGANGAGGGAGVDPGPGRLAARRVRIAPRGGWAPTSARRRRGAIRRVAAADCGPLPVAPRSIVRREG